MNEKSVGEKGDREEKGMNLTKTNNINLPPS